MINLWSLTNQGENENCIVIQILHVIRVTSIYNILYMKKFIDIISIYQHFEYGIAMN